MKHSRKPKTELESATLRDTPTRARVWQKHFLEALRKCGTVRHACQAAGVVRSTAYRAKEADATFAAQWDEALADGVDLLEAEARRRAVEGVEKPVFQGGVQVGVIREFSDTLLLALLRAHRPEKFREGAVNVGIGVGVKIDSPADVERRARAILPWIEKREGLEPGSIARANGLE